MVLRYLNPDRVEVIWPGRTQGPEDGGTARHSLAARTRRRLVGMTQHVPQITLNNDVTMPALGFGVFQSAPQETADAVATALATGYQALERLLADGLVRAIGVSSFLPHHLDTLLERTEVAPAVNQVEVHPLFSQPAVQAADAAHGKSAAQVMLRWHLQQGRSAIPKSTDPGRIAENFAVLDLELTADELARIDALDTGVRGGPDPDGWDPSEREFVIPEA